MRTKELFFIAVVFLLVFCSFSSRAETKILSGSNEIGYTQFTSGNVTTYVVDSGKNDEITVLNERQESGMTDISVTKMQGINIFSITENPEKISPKLLDAETLEKEGYLKNGKVPVIIRLDVNETEERQEKQAEEKTTGFVLGTEAKVVQNENFEQAKTKVLEKLNIEEENNVNEEENDAALPDSSGINKIRKNIGKTPRISGDSENIKTKKVEDLKIINSIATEVNHNELNELAELDSVKKIELDEEVHILLDATVPLINATQVWQLISDGRNVTGANVSIAIIDTGVDYTHPDLGGCFGSGCKVAGGYDFYNSDSNPMDDHGHGTHVAGTAASNGSLKGVAPDAILYAYKVLGSGGSGSTSKVISGVQRATDPNNDGNYSDHVDIISMSLGGYGDEDSSLSQAVDTAVNRGVVAVVAAGNSGTSTNAIGSPASSRKAVTVAASDNSDSLASFSSRGPTSQYNIKPDLAAPGVSICASQWDSAWSSYQCYDSRHVSISGTSMATPHVSGAAALLLQANPTWTPEIIKSALISTTNDINLKVWEQGSGRVNAIKAINASVASYPQSISFGQVTEENISQVITVQNLKDTTLSLNLSLGLVKDDDGTSYDIASLNTSSLTIGANSNQTVNLSIAIENNTGTFYGYINITDGSDIYRIPYGFIRLSQLTVTVTNGSASLRPIYISIHNNDLSTIKYAGWYSFSGNSHTFNVNPGQYVAHAIGDITDRNLVYILTGNVTTQAGASTTIDLDIQDANLFNVSAAGVGGELLDIYKWQYLLDDVSGSNRFVTSMTYLGTIFSGNRTVYITNMENETATSTISLSYIGFPNKEKPSDVSSSYWGDRIFNSAPRTYYTGWLLTNPSGGQQLTPPDTFVNYSYAYNYPGWSPNEKAAYDSYIAINFWISPKATFDASSWIKVSAPLKRTNYISNTSWGYWHYMMMSYLRNDTHGGDWRTEFAAMAGQRERDKAYVSTWPRGSRVNTTRDIYFGTSYLPTYFKNTNNQIALEDYMLSGKNNETYIYKSSYVTWQSTTGESGTVYLPTPNILIYRGGTLVSNSTPTAWKTFSYPASSGDYIVNITLPTDYPLYNRTYISAEFTLPGSDVNPPKLTYINVTPRFEINSLFGLEFNITDDVSVSGVSAYYSTDRTTWTEMPLTNTSSAYNSSITITNSSADEVNIKINATDSTGNAITFRIVPVSMVARNITLNFAVNPTTADPGDEIVLGGIVGDTTNSQNISIPKIDYYVDSSLHLSDRAGYGRIPGQFYSYGVYSYRYTIPDSYSSSTMTLDAVFNGTGVYNRRNETTVISVNVPVVSQLPVFSSHVRTPSSPNATDTVKINITVTNTTALDTVLFESNYTGTWINHSATNTGNTYNHTISSAYLSAGEVISYKFIANTTGGQKNSSAQRTFTVQEISANLTVGETLDNINTGQNNTLWCDYVSNADGADITGATANAEIDDANQSMTYNSTSGRYEYNYSSGTTGTKTWRCFASKTSYQSKSAAGSFSIGEQDAPDYTGIARTSDPIYKNMTVAINTTWTDDTGLGHIILSSNHTGSWANYTIVTSPPSPYVASYNISSLSNGQVVGWKYIANDTSGNMNNLMPIQNFTVRNRAPVIALDSNSNNQGWGETWSFTVNISDSDSDDLNVTLWTRKPGGNFVFKESQIADGHTLPVYPNSKQASFSVQLNKSYIGTSMFKINVTDGVFPDAVNSTITVEKDDTTITVTRGFNDTVQRYGASSITLGITIYDSDKGEYTNTTGKIYWTGGGSTPYDNEQSCTSTNGNCSVSIDPDDVYTTGAQYFYGATLSNDSYYKQANSSQEHFGVNGTIFASLNGPVGVYNSTSLIYLNTTFTDDTSNSLSVDTAYLEYKDLKTAYWKICTPVNESTEANYYCILNASSLAFGIYGVRYHGEKVNYTSVNTTVYHQFTVATVTKFETKANFTARAKKRIRSDEINTTFEIFSVKNLTNMDINVTFNSTNPKPRNMSVRELGKYVSINVSTELENNLSHAIIKINYTDEELNNSGLVEESLRIYYYNGTDWTAYDPPDGGVNTAENYVWANVTHFSDFGVGGKKNNNLSCTYDDECNSGNCASDYDGYGSWCAPSGNCAHDYITTYTNSATVCYGTYLETCSSGSWTATLCSNTCSGGACIASVAATSSSGGGGGGGGATTTIKYSKNQVKISIPSIPANSTKVIMVSNTTASDVKNISINVKNKVEKVELSINKLTAKPSGIPDISRNVYHYLQIDEENITDNDVSNVRISFFVENSWITGNNINETTIELYHYDGAWRKISTTITGRDLVYTYFESESPGLSVFAITGKKIIEETQEPPVIPAEPAETEEKEHVCGDGVCGLGEKCPDDCYVIAEPSPEGMDIQDTAVIVIILIALVVLGWFVVYKPLKTIRKYTKPSKKRKKHKHRRKNM